MKKMTAPEAINRGLNFLVIVIISIIGIGSIHEVIGENDYSDKIEDGFYIVITIIAIIWYLFSSKAIKRTLIPLYILIIGLLTKSVGIYVERADNVANIPDFAYVGILGTTLVIFLYQYFKYRKQTET